MDPTLFPYEIMGKLHFDISSLELCLLGCWLVVYLELSPTLIERNVKFHTDTAHFLLWLR